MSKAYLFNDIAYNITTKKVPTEADMATYIGLEHLESGSLYVKEFGSKVPIKGEKLAMTKGDILLGKRNAYLRRAAIAPHDGLFSAHGMLLRPKTDVIDERFFPFFIASDYFFDEAIRISVGGLSPTINWKDLKNVEFELPTIEEQRVLADKLWAAYELKEAYKKMIAATDEMVKSQFIEMFGNIEYDLCNKKLSDYAELQGGFAFKSELFAASGIPIIRISNINDGTVEIDDSVCYCVDFWNDNPSYRIKRNDILIAMSGATTGKSGIYDRDEPALLNQRVACISAKEGISISSFLFCALQSDSMYKIIQDRAQGGAQPNISGKQIENLPMPDASLDNQLSFDKIVNQADKSKYIS